jgi:hypothetical protein
MENRHAWLIVIDNGNTEEIHAYATLQTASDGWAFFTLLRKDRGYFSMTMKSPSGKVHQRWELE